MAALPDNVVEFIGGKKIATLTRDAIFKHYEDNSNSGFRVHLGASIIGKDCERAIYYDFHWTTLAEFKGRMLRLFETGQLEEPRLVKDLRNIGVIVHEVDESTGRQFNVSAVGGHFGGSLDGIALGILEAPKTWHVCEFKTHKASSYADLEKKGVRESKPQHYAQMQTYMFLMGYERALYAAKNKDTEELYLERVDLNKPFAEALIKKAERIIKAVRPPERISANKTFFKCKLCDHAALCHEEKLPEINCRTCIASTAMPDGGWHCGKFDLYLTTQQQRIGCENHKFNPTLINMKQTDAAEDGSWVEYTKADGTKFKDGDKR